MSNIYKLQRFTGDAWVDVKLGQEASASQLEDYLTLSQISGQFLSTQLLTGNLSSYALYQMPYAHAVGQTSVAFGSSVARGKNSAAFGSSGTYYPSVMTPGLYWDGTQFYAPAIPGSLEVLQWGMLKISTDSFGIFYLVIDTISFDSSNAKYIFTFSQTLGDWSSFINIVDGITDTNKRITATVQCLTHSAAGNYSLISGVNCQTTSEASCAHAFGQGLIANSPTQTVIGSYNQKNSDAKFIVGGGTSDNMRTNLFEVYNNEVKIYQPITIDGQITYKPESFGGRLDVYWKYNATTKGWTPSQSIPSGNYLVEIRYAPDIQNDAFTITGWCSICQEMSSFSIEFFKNYGGRTQYSKSDRFYGWRPPRRAEWFFYESYRTGNDLALDWKQLSSNNSSSYVISFIRLY